MMDCLKPSPSVLVKIGSILTHVEEAISTKGHAFDYAAFKALMEDPEVTAWLKQMDKLALLPKKR